MKKRIVNALDCLVNGHDWVPYEPGIKYCRRGDHFRKIDNALWRLSPMDGVLWVIVLIVLIGICLIAFLVTIATSTS